jgi:hypothetical protein
MTVEARNQSREVVTSWVRDQITVRDAEIMWIGRRRELLIHEKIKIRRWQTQAFNLCVRILKTHEGARIIAITPDLAVW